MRLGEDVVVVDVPCETAKSVLGLTGVRAAFPSVGSRDHKADRERKNHLRPVEEHHALTCTKHGSVMELHQFIAS